MTRSTNMEHVEVLRELSARWRASRRAYDGSADDALADCADELDAAIASLSAQQSGDWVLVRRSAIESAIETLENDGDEHGEGRNLRAAIDEAAAPQPPAEEQPCGCGEATCTVPWEPGCGLGKSEQHAEAQPRGRGCGDHDHASYIPGCGLCSATLPEKRMAAPPSAPVGVEGLIAEWKMLIAHPDTSTIMRATLENVVIRLQHTHAQQPAAEVYVDFPQVGTAGPLAVVDGKVTLPDTTMNDLIRHARTGYVEQPAAVDGAIRRDAERYRWLRDSQGRPGERYPYKVTVRLPTGYSHPNELDAAIDQARGKGVQDEA